MVGNNVSDRCWLGRPRDSAEIIRVETVQAAAAAAVGRERKNLPTHTHSVTENHDV